MRGVAPTAAALAGLAALVALAGLTTAAWAHGNGVLDLEPMESLVAQRASETTGRTHKAYAALGRRLERDVRRPLVDELPKLRAVASATRRRLADDGALIALLEDAADDAGRRLAGEPDDVVQILRRIEREKDRRRVRSLADRAARDEAKADARGDGGDLRGRLRLYLACAKHYAAADTLAARLLVRQARRGAPGQPVVKGPSGTIDTYAGSGIPAPGPEGVPALVASFAVPQDVALEPTTGRLYVADQNNHRVRRLDADGRVRTVAGSGVLGDTAGPALSAELHHPSGLAFDPTTGDLFIAGWHASRVIRLDFASGDIVRVAGDGELGFGGDGDDVAQALFNYPVDIVFEDGAYGVADATPDGSWLLADQGNLRIRRVDAVTRRIETFAGTGIRGFEGDGGPAVDACFNFPNGDFDGPSGRIALSPDGRYVYVADTGNRRIRRIDRGASGNTITTFAGNGMAGTDGDGGPALAASLTAPVDVACDILGNVLVCDRDASVIRRIDVTTGLITTFAGSGASGYAGDGGPAAAARLDLPSALCVDRVRGRVYIAEAGNHVVRVVWE